jgi:ATP synthase protein I
VNGNTGNARPPDSNKNTFWEEALSALSLGWELAIPIFGGVLAGYALDRWLGTGHIFTLGLLVLGIFIGFMNLWRFHKRLENSQRESDDDDSKKD